MEIFISDASQHANMRTIKELHTFHLQKIKSWPIII
jgi:hypothetical protein